MHTRNSNMLSGNSIIYDLVDESKQENKRDVTLARPVGRGGRILNAVGRLSSLNLLTMKGAPKGANGRIVGFNIEVSGKVIAELAFEPRVTAFSADLSLSAVTSACGDETTVPESLDLDI